MSELPQNLQAERGLLGIILNNNDTIHDIVELTKMDFAEQHNGELFILFKDQISAGRSITAVTILHDAQDAVIWESTGLTASAYLAKLENDAPLGKQAERAKEFATTIRDTALSRRLVISMDELRAWIIASPASIPAVVQRDKVDSTMTSLFSSSADLGMNDVAAVGTRMLDRIKDADKEIGRHIGLSFVQNLTGPLLPGRMMMLGGTSGSGKSGLLAQIARYDAEHGGTPILFTREMRDEEVVSRLLSADTGISGSQIERNMLSPEEYEKLWTANEAMKGLRFKISSPSQFSVPFIRARSLRQQRLGGLTLIEVDHVHLLAKSDRRMTDYEAMNENLEALKALAMDLGVPIIVACQLTGEALKDLNRWPHRLPIFTDLLFSATIDRNADIVLIIHRLEHVLKRNRPIEKDDPKQFDAWTQRVNAVEGQVEALLTKRRGGRGEGQQTGYFDASRVLFADAPFRRAFVQQDEPNDLWATRA